MTAAVASMPLPAYAWCHARCDVIIDYIHICLYRIYSIYIYISNDYVYMYDPSCMTINVDNKCMYIIHDNTCISHDSTQVPEGTLLQVWGKQVRQAMVQIGRISETHPRNTTSRVALPLPRPSFRAGPGGILSHETRGERHLSADL